MSHFNEITTLQYMGSKSRIIDEICPPIVGNENIKTVVDLFAGTGTIGYALKSSFSIISNDLEYYAYILNEGILNGCLLTDTQIENFLSSCTYLERKIENYCEAALTKEEYFFSTDVSEPIVKEYQDFCNQTPSVVAPKSKNTIFNGIEILVGQVVPGEEHQNLPIPALFLTYYANAYFGIKQCCEIDAIRTCISLLKNRSAQYVLLTALMSAMSEAASTTTHFAQYLKINGISSYKNIIEKRRTSIYKLLVHFINDYKAKGLFEYTGVHSICYNLDYLELLHSISLDETTMVYADPPYFKEHYSRYYHILNTLCKYDYPVIANNPQTREYSIGRYRLDRNVSDFGKRKTALAAFKEMIKICAQNKAWLTISYSSNSLVKIEDILAVMSEYYHVQTIQIPLRHSKQGRTSSSVVNEYLFTGKPTCSCKVAGQKQVQELLQTLSSMKPLTDSPAGLMHNYMARKPYNIVNKIISQLCPTNGVVYDPMMGSGTTLIEASKLNVRSIGTDINPLAYLITKTSLTSWNLEKIKTLLGNFVNSISSQCANIYAIKENGEIRIIERCHFDKADGKIQKLLPTSYWYKTVVNGKLSGRKKAEATDHFIAEYSKYENQKLVNIKDSTLIPNSRIAIGPNDTVNMYFCARNLLVLDTVIGELKKSKKQYGYSVLEFMVSSAINLIKLSDKKASSQMPYWTPKRNVTSRNAICVLKQKEAAILHGLTYLSSQCHLGTVDSFSDLYASPSAMVLNSPAQSISYVTLPKQSIDLILTDPPYTDQVPYLEYSQLWSHLLGWEKGSSDRLLRELVVSDAPSRDKDMSDFNKIFNCIIKRTANSVKDGGYFAMFYHSFDLVSWDNILTLMGQYGFAYQGQAPIATSRKSFKTIMSPNSTLNGNYVIIFRKRNQHQLTFEGTIADAEKAAIECARSIIQSGKTTSQDLYDHGMLKDAVEKGYLSLLAKKYRSFPDVLSSNFVCEHGYWREKNVLAVRL